jgi:integrase
LSPVEGCTTTCGCILMGLRKGELAAVRYRDFDLGRRVRTFDQSREPPQA